MKEYSRYKYECRHHHLICHQRHNNYVPLRHHLPLQRLISTLHSDEVSQDNIEAFETSESKWHSQKTCTGVLQRFVGSLNIQTNIKVMRHPHSTLSPSPSPSPSLSPSPPPSPSPSQSSSPSPSPPLDHCPGSCIPRISPDCIRQRLWQCVHLGLAQWPPAAHREWR